MATPRPFFARLRNTAARRASRPPAPTAVSLPRPGSRPLGLGAVALALAAGPAAAPARAQAPLPQGPEFRVNTHTRDEQIWPAVAMDADGDFVVVWTSANQDGSSSGVYAQLFDAAGIRQGTEFRVNTTTLGAQSDPAVAMDADGDFVVGWVSYDGSERGIFAQRFDAAGEPQGPEFLVNTDTGGSQLDPAVTMDADGDFVFVWQSFYVIYARRYSASGAPQSGAFSVNTGPPGAMIGPSVAMDDDGDFVVAWSDWPYYGYGGDGSGAGVFARRYDAAGTPRGDEFAVNTTIPGNQQGPAIAVDSDGDVVIAWWEYSGGAGTGVYVQRYDAAGVPRGIEAHLGSFPTGRQREPSATMDADGDYVVAWASYDQDESDAGVFAQRFDAAGEAQGPEFRVNTFTLGRQWDPAVAMDADGDFVVAWTSEGQDGSRSGIYAQRYRSVLVAAEPGPAGTAPSAVVSPNPIRGAGVMRLMMAESGWVRVGVHDVLGREAAVLHEGPLGPGPHYLPVDASALAPGVYLVCVEAGGTLLTRQLTVNR